MSGKKITVHWYEKSRNKWWDDEANPSGWIDLPDDECIAKRESNTFGLDVVAQLRYPGQPLMIVGGRNPVIGAPSFTWTYCNHRSGWDNWYTGFENIYINERKMVDAGEYFSFKVYRVPTYDGAKQLRVSLTKLSEDVDEKLSKKCLDSVPYVDDDDGSDYDKRKKF